MAGSAANTGWFEEFILRRFDDLQDFFFFNGVIGITGDGVIPNDLGKNPLSIPILLGEISFIQEVLRQVIDRPFECLSPGTLHLLQDLVSCCLICSKDMIARLTPGFPFSISFHER